jgi:hypothetical protein
MTKLEKRLKAAIERHAMAQGLRNAADRELYAAKKELASLLADWYATKK